MHFRGTCSGLYEHCVCMTTDLLRAATAISTLWWGRAALSARGCGQGRTPMEQRDAVIAGFPKVRLSTAKSSQYVLLPTVEIVHRGKNGQCSGAALVPARFPVQPLGRRAERAHHAALLRLAGGADAGRGGHAARRHHPAQRRKN